MAFFLNLFFLMFFLVSFRFYKIEMRNRINTSSIDEKGSKLMCIIKMIEYLIALLTEYINSKYAYIIF